MDRKSSEFCPEDRAILVAAGILKAKEEGGCIPVATLPAGLDAVAEKPRFSAEDALAHDGPKLSTK